MHGPVLGKLRARCGDELPACRAACYEPKSVSVARERTAGARESASAESALPLVSVIVPAHDEVRAIRMTIEGIARALRHIHFELIVVDDGSTDGTGEEAESALSERTDSVLVTHPHQRGYGAALKTGMRKARAEWIAITDADGTYPSERLAELLEVALEQRADMVVGARTSQSTIRRIPKWFLVAWAASIAGRPIPDLNSGLRVFRRSVAERYFHLLPDGFSFTTTITLAMHSGYFDVRYVPVDYTERIGRSKIRPIRDTLAIFALILRTGVYFAPLRVFVPLAIVFGAVTATSLAYDVFIAENIGDKTVLAFAAFVQTVMIALIADMIVRRGSR